MNQRQKSLLSILAVALFLGLALPLWAEDVQGKIAGVNTEKNQLIITENFKNWTFQLDRDGKVYLNDRPCKLGELQAGDDARVTFTRQGERLLASVVRSVRK